MQPIVTNFVAVLHRGMKRGFRQLQAKQQVCNINTATSKQYLINNFETMTNFFINIPIAMQKKLYFKNKHYNIIILIMHVSTQAIVAKYPRMAALARAPRVAAPLPAVAVNLPAQQPA